MGGGCTCEMHVSGLRQAFVFFFFSFALPMLFPILNLATMAESYCSMLWAFACPLVKSSGLCTQSG